MKPLLGQIKLKIEYADTFSGIFTSQMITLYLFFLRLVYRNVNNTLCRALKPVIILEVPYFTDFFCDGYIVPFVLTKIA